jgi:hypothetical protein
LHQQRGHTLGYYNNSSDAGFVRSPSGTFSNLNSPGAFDTFPLGTNATGDIAGYYYDYANVAHGFIRSAAGSFATFEAPGASLVYGRGTFAKSINDTGAVTGFYLDSVGVFHGFVLVP